MATRDPGADGQPSEAVAFARVQTRQELGAKLEEKASDRFCLSFAAGTPAPALLTLEAAESAPVVAGGGGGRQLPAVIEFTEPDRPPGQLPDRLEPAIGSELWERLGDLVEEIPHSEKALALLLRSAGVKATKDDFLRQCGPVRDELERTAAILAGPPRRLAGPTSDAPAQGVQVCWLNRTARAVADARAFAEVVADPSVKNLDLPRLLEPEQLTIDVTLRAAAELRAAQEGHTGRGVTVGVIDSEVARTHPAFGERVIHRTNFTDEPFGAPGDHGTAVAGFIGADSADFQGMAPECTIYNYKVLATVKTLTGDDFDGALAIEQALEDGVRVVNCSWGAGPIRERRSREARACDTAWRLGLTIVKSAGNKGPGAGTLTTPADADGVIVVGATDGDGLALQDYSSRGPTTDGRERPHLLAPGGELNDGLVSAVVGGGFGDVGAGTSYAAPHVAGLLALLVESEPELSPTEQRERLLAACTAIDGLDPDLQGAGLLDPVALFS